jgi:SH3-like domain-containing protein
MTTIPENRKLMYFVMYFLAACIVLALLTSCSPYAAMSEISDTATATASMTATVLHPNLGNSTPPPPPSCTVTAYTLNMRTGAGMSYAVKWILEQGDRLQIAATAGDWLKIETAQHVTGWIHSHYCK